MKQHSKEELAQSEKVENIVALPIFAVIMLVAVGFFTNWFGLAGNGSGLGSNIVVPYDDEAVRGSSDSAKVVIFIFSDFECPFCKKGEDTVQRVFDKYAGRVALVFKQYPLMTIHPNALNSALASECANEQGKFWEYHDMLFAHQNALSLVDLKAYAKELGLNSEQFGACLDSQKYIYSIQRDIKAAQEIGITSTPTFIVDGEAIVGAQPEEEFDRVIQAALKN